MKFRAYETFSLRKGWLHKGLAGIQDDGRLFYYKDSTPMDRLGIGSNMVKALKYWLLACGLVREQFVEGRREMILSEIGQIIWDNDPYFQEIGTYQILHYLLSSNKDMATSWYFVFNVFNVTEFSKKDFENALKTYISENENETVPSDRAISDDYECVIRTYFNKKDDLDPESNMVCPLTILELLSVSKDKTVIKTNPKNLILNSNIALAILINETQKAEKSEIRIADIEKAPCNIGRTFNLDNISVSKILDQLRNMDSIKVIRTAGLDVIRIKTNFTFTDCIQNYYESIR